MTIKSRVEVSTKNTVNPRGGQNFFKGSEDEYVPASETVNTTPEEVQHMIEAVLKVYDETYYNVLLTT